MFNSGEMQHTDIAKLNTQQENHWVPLNNPINTLYLPTLTHKLSCIMRESHACGSKIVTSRIHTNLWNSLIMLKIGWKSLALF